MSTVIFLFVFALIGAGVVAIINSVVGAGKAAGRATGRAVRNAVVSKKVVPGTGQSQEFFRAARRSPFDVLACLDNGDIDGARLALQKIGYMVHADKDRYPDKVRQFTELMCMFVRIDPLFSQCLNVIKPVIAQSPGIRQTALYEHLSVDVETARYVLYFAGETGHLIRRKKGNSYEVFLPGQPMPLETPKAPRKRTPKASATSGQ